MAAPSLTIALTQDLNRGIVLLEQLHVLSQTEALLLEKSDFGELEPLVRAKERLASQIDENKNHLADTLTRILPLPPELPAASRASLELLKQRALQLMEMIDQVDGRNRVRLENIKAQAVQSSRVLFQDDKLRRAYTIPDLALSGFSGLFD